jgi:hypothetical protein
MAAGDRTQKYSREVDSPDEDEERPGRPRGRAITNGTPSNFFRLENPDREDA